MLTAAKVRMATRMVGPITQNFLRRTARPTALRSSSSATLMALLLLALAHTRTHMQPGCAPLALRRHYGCRRVKHGAVSRSGAPLWAPTRAVAGSHRGCVHK